MRLFQSYPKMDVSETAFTCCIVRLWSAFDVNAPFKVLCSDSNAPFFRGLHESRKYSKSVQFYPLDFIPLPLGLEVSFYGNIFFKDEKQAPVLVKMILSSCAKLSQYLCWWCPLFWHRKVEPSQLSLIRNNGLVNKLYPIVLFRMQSTKNIWINENR